MNILFRLASYDVSSIPGIENSPSESDKMEAAVSLCQAHLEGKTSSGPTIWQQPERALYNVYLQD